MTQRVINAISLYKPDKLYVVADGPKNIYDYEKCLQTRNLVNALTWECEVVTNYSDTNLGCGIRVSSGISWAFELCDQAIILEDDCVPNLSFWGYCEELLERYKFDNRIGIISGDLFINVPDIVDSYYFTNFPHVWGWATWQRTWTNYDFSMKHWPDVRETSLLLDKTGSEFYANKWKDIFYRVHNGEVDTWDYQLVYMIWTQNQICIAPKFNLVSNIGFGVNSTHTNDSKNKMSSIPTQEISLPLLHPKLVYRNREKDNADLIYNLGPFPPRSRGISKRIKRFLRNTINK